MARGFGWNSHAALRADLGRQPMERSTDEQPFSVYLRAHHFPNIPHNTLCRAAIACKIPERTAIRGVMEQEPVLTRFGFGIYRNPQHTPEEHRREFRKNREALLSPHAVDEFLRASEYLSFFPTRRTINPRAFSYGLKHAAEGYHRDRGNKDNYVSNGALIAAAIYLGFNYRVDGPNAHFNMGAKQEHPVPHANAPGKCVKTQPRKRSRNTLRQLAWRNMMIAAINAGIEQHVFGLDPDDNHWTGQNTTYEFTLGTIPALACVGDAGRGELIFHVAAQPTKDAHQWIRSDNAGLSVGEAFAAGWLERRDGQWLQTSDGPICAFRRKLLPSIAQSTLEPNGYRSEGRIM
jgi:hypothetical protein